MRLRVRVPASTSNLGPGFDCLGLALDRYLEIEVETQSQGLRIEVGGRYPRGIALDASNLVHACLSRALRRAGQPVPGLRLRIHNDIPIGRGLGSSAAATLAGLVAGEILAAAGVAGDAGGGAVRGAGGDGAPDVTRVLHAAAEIEGHPDNVAPALLGGFVASALDAGSVRTVRLAFPERLSIVLVVPEREVPTEAARRLLPASVPRADAVFNLSSLALLLGALQLGDFATVRRGMQDRLHQEVRLGLVPGLGGALSELAAEPRCVAAALSGSGPTLLGLFLDPGPDAGQTAIRSLSAHGIAANVLHVRPDPRGVWWEAQP